VLCTLNKEDILNELIQAHDLPLEKMREVYNAAKNKVENDKPKIGSRFAGGIVFYVDKKGQHGLTCSENDLGSHKWSDRFWDTGATSNEIGEGRHNTDLILSKSKIEVVEDEITYETVIKKEYDIVYDTVKDGWFSTKKIERKIERQVEKTIPIKKEVQKTITIDCAARRCADCNINGYTDWYLPTLKELRLIYERLHLTKIRMLKGKEYWSSSEYSERGAHTFSFFDNEPKGRLKDQSYYIIPIRSFQES
jgi:hypothetical protein